MSIKLLIDMNLSPRWIPLLAQHGWAAIHWSSIGNHSATDRTIMEWARINDHVVFTHDLDFGNMSPSPIKVSRVCFRFAPKTSCRIASANSSSQRFASTNQT